MKTTKDNLLEYVLPAYYASYLINGDPSGITEEEINNLDEFFYRENLTLRDCVDCDTEEHFCRLNDMANEAGNVMNFYFSAKERVCALV